METPKERPSSPLPPPLLESRPVVEEYFGVQVTDPYRYMENLDDPEVIAWFKAHSEHTRHILNRISGRQGLIDKMREFDQRQSEVVTNLQITENDRYFYIKTRSGEETGSLYYRDGFEGTEHFLYAPQSFAPDTDRNYIIPNFTPSNDGSHIAIEVAPDGSESSVLLIMHVDDHSLYPEQIDRCWFPSPSWLPDGERFFYNRLRSSDIHDMDREKDSKVYLHRIGSEPVIDVEIFSREHNPELGILPEEIPIVRYEKDSQHIFGIAASVDNRIKMYAAPAIGYETGDIAWRPLLEREDAVYDIKVTDKELFLYTPKGSPNFKILCVPLDDPDLEKAQVVIPEPAQGTLTGFELNAEGLYYKVAYNGVQIRLFHLPKGTSTAVEIALPFPAGNVIIATKGFKFADVWATISGWTRDTRRFRYIAKSKAFKLEMLSTWAEYPEFADLVVEELMVPSHDGMKVPLSLIYKKGLEKNGRNPTMLYGYGAYGISINPDFNPNFLLWPHEGGVMAVAHVRGGGELGHEWYMAGYKKTKPNTWKDLIACAEYLIAEGYTRPDHLAISGGSAGGILIGRAMTERPDLFAAAIPMVGCMNAVRMENSPNGPINVPEFGTVEDPDECQALIEMDAYLNLVEGTAYPATLITAGINDPRVIAWQPGKFAANLMAKNASSNPVYFWADFNAGHGIGDTKSKEFESRADRYSFALWQTDHPKYRLAQSLQNL